MHSTRSSATLLMLAAIILHGCLALAASASAVDNSLGDIYSSMLQREYTGPISYPNHQVERKAQRSPSLRLRFGRRSDTNFPLFGNRFSKYIEEINKKPIRSPSLRLRFGKRDPMYSEDYYSNELNDINRDANNRWAAEQMEAANAPLLEQTEYDAVPEKRKSVHLRFGRSYSVHDDIPINDRPEVLTDDAVSIPRLNSHAPKPGDLSTPKEYSASRSERT